MAGTKDEHEELTPALIVQQAFLQLHFALKLYYYVKNNNINKDVFDKEIIVSPPNEKSVILPLNTFQSNADLITAAYNFYSITLGYVAISMDNALIKAGYIKKPEDNSPNMQLVSVIYMLRCAFAHNMMRPMWEAKGPYKRRFSIAFSENDNLVVDFSNLCNETPFNEDLVGGKDGIFKFEGAVLKMLKAPSLTLPEEKPRIINSGAT